MKILVRLAGHVNVDTEGGPTARPGPIIVGLHVGAEPLVDVLDKVRKLSCDRRHSTHLAMHIKPKGCSSRILASGHQDLSSVLAAEGHHL